MCSSPNAKSTPAANWLTPLFPKTCPKPAPHPTPSPSTHKIPTPSPFCVPLRFAPAPNLGGRTFRSDIGRTDTYRHFDRSKRRETPRLDSLYPLINDPDLINDPIVRSPQCPNPS